MSKCPVFKIIGTVGKKWTPVLIQEIDLNGKKGFNVLFRRMAKIGPRTLSRKLKELESCGIIKKEIVLDKKSLRTRYLLTQDGREILKSLENLKSIGARMSGKSLECQEKVCVSCPFY